MPFINRHDGTERVPSFTQSDSHECVPSVDSTIDINYRVPRGNETLPPDGGRSLDMGNLPCVSKVVNCLANRVRFTR